MEAKAQERLAEKRKLDEATRRKSLVSNTNRCIYMIGQIYRVIPLQKVGPFQVVTISMTFNLLGFCNHF